MNNVVFNNVDEYIDLAPAAIQPLLLTLRKTILDSAPAGTKEVISYKMPTYKYNGNLIHFAFFKNHIGLYPGSDAIEHFSDDLRGLKTSRGAIQIPLDYDISKQLVADIVTFNAEKLKDKEVPDWHKYNENWGEAYEFMNRLIQNTDLIKERKWGNDIYTHNGKNVIGWAGFKDFFSLWFYNGVFLKDEEKVLISASEGKTKSLRQWRFTDIKEMDEKKILSYIYESIQTITDGKEIKPEKASVKQAEGVLKEALEEDIDFKKAFSALTPGKQREYIIYIEEAKQDATKISRVVKIRPLVLAGKSLNDKYKR